jgi:hypothetical protein
MGLYKTFVSTIVRHKGIIFEVVFNTNAYHARNCANGVIVKDEILLEELVEKLKKNVTTIFNCTDKKIIVVEEELTYNE